MPKILVISNSKTPLMPCHPARARELLKKKKAAVYRHVPFTIILKNSNVGIAQQIEFKADPGSKTTGLALVVKGKRGRKVAFAANLSHRGQAIKNSLDSRRASRKFRRHRKTRYRKPRFNNRTRRKGWLPPSLQSRVDNIFLWHKKLSQLCPIHTNVIETVRFDTQKIQNPEIKGVEYQQGTIFGYEIRKYLLEKFNRTCVYCTKKNIPLQIEHILPKSRGGSNRISNLTLACQPCNQAKGKLLLQEFVKDSAKVTRILAATKSSLKDAAAVTATRSGIGRVLKYTGRPTTFWSGGLTKCNRVEQGYDKDHWLDAVCVGETGQKVFIPSGFKPFLVKATGRGKRQMCRVNKFGFPCPRAKSVKRVFGFQTGDLVKAIIPKGKYQGTYKGKVTIRATGCFDIKTRFKKIPTSFRNCSLVQRLDG